MEKITIVVILVAFLAACGGGKSSSESAPDAADETTTQTTDIPSIGVSGINLEPDGETSSPAIVITNISFSPGSGQLSKANSSLRATIDFEYDPDNFDTGGNAFENTLTYSIKINHDSKDTQITSNVGKVDRANGRGKVLLSFSLSNSETGLYNKAVGIITTDPGGSIVTDISSRTERVNFIVVE